MIALEYLRKQSRTSLLILGVILVFLIGLLDYVTGSEISVSIFFLIPVSIVAWYVGQREGTLLAILSAMAWLIADELGDRMYSSPTIPYWNALVRLGFFLIVTYTLSALYASQKRKDELAQFIIHDLRSPLSVIITGLRLLQEMGGENMPVTQKEVATMCLDSGERMLILITSLLDLAQLENGQLPLHVESLSVTELVESALRHVSVWATQNHIVLTSQLEPNVAQVYADSTITTRILINLLSNAIKFSPPNAMIMIRVAPYDSQMVAFSVADQGRGIEKEWVDKVFDKFAQAESSQKQGVASSGLGLTFCRLAVEAQRGHIWLTSEVGKGTVVSFTLPAKPPNGGK